MTAMQANPTRSNGAAEQRRTRRAWRSNEQRSAAAAAMLIHVASTALSRAIAASIAACVAVQTPQHRRKEIQRIRQGCLLWCILRTV